MQKIRKNICPFCGAKQKFCIFPETGTYFCYKCRKWGRGEDLKNKEGIETLSKFTASLDPPTESREASLTLPSGFKILKRGGIGYNYLKGRDINPNPLIPFVGVAENYLYFPMYKKGQLVYYVGRKMFRAGPRYKNAPGSPPSLFIPYEMKKVRKVLVIVEGIFDCFKVYQATGVPTMALLGKELTSFKIAQILSLSSSKKLVTIIIMLDPDAYLTSLKYLDILRPLRQVDIIKLAKTDPGDMKREEIREVIKDG